MNIIEYSELTDELARAGCLVKNMPNDAYHAYPAINKSSLDLISRSPAHYAFAPPREQTRAMVIGSAIHAAILEPASFASDYLLLKDITDRRSSEYKQAVKAHSADYVLTGKEAQQVTDMQASVQRSSAAPMLTGGYAELAVFATDPETGELCKIKIDYLTADLIAIDLKSTQDIRDFYKSVGNYNYHMQDAFYSDVFEWATGQPLQAFRFLAVEKELPCAVKLFELDHIAKQAGRKMYRDALNTYAECNASGHWPAPSDELEYISLPSWITDTIDDEQGEF